MDSNNWRVKRSPSDSPTVTTPNRSSQFRRSNGPGDSRDSPRSTESFNSRSSPAARSPFQSRDSVRRPLNDSLAEKAIDEGRRLYVGNLTYDTSVKDIESLFNDVSVEAINMSIDPLTGRNPSYCFVDLESKALADKVMNEFNDCIFRGRPLKVKPGIKSGSGTGRFHMKPTERQSNGDDFAFDRWRRLDAPEDLEVAVKEGRRLYVGGLPRFKDQPFTNIQIRELFHEYNVEVVGKLISAHESKKELPGHHDFCFVELATAEEALRAVQALDGTSKWDSIVKIRLASGNSGKLRERRRLFVGGLPEFPDQQSTEAGMKELFEGFEITTTSKLFLPKDEAKKDQPGNHCFCFVELANEDQTDRAIASLDWKEIWGSNVRVKPGLSSGRSDKDASRPQPRGWAAPRD